MQSAAYSFMVSGDNIANISTPDFKASEVLRSNSGQGPSVTIEKTDHGTDLVHEMSEQMRTVYDFKANAKVIRSHDEMLGNLIDILAWSSAERKLLFNC